MALRDIIGHIDDFDDESTVYAVPEWTPGSLAVVAREPECGGVPEEASRRGMKYFLEVFLVKEVLAGLSDVDLERKTTRVIDYAIADA